jgi:hypothetical protein
MIETDVQGSCSDVSIQILETFHCIRWSCLRTSSICGSVLFATRNWYNQLFPKNLGRSFAKKHTWERTEVLSSFSFPKKEMSYYLALLHDHCSDGT